ncbi:MAG: hypothetical protein COB50_01265 [Thiotrichales bacterium]|nr:MAG: hypothetical protein COB50_01265 [Thiotrichales bacterium]
MYPNLNEKKIDFENFYAPLKNDPQQSKAKKFFTDKEERIKNIFTEERTLYLKKLADKAKKEDKGEHTATIELRKLLRLIYEAAENEKNSIHVDTKKETSLALKILMTAIFLLVSFTYFCSTYGYISSMTPIFWMRILFASFSMLANAVFFTQSVPDLFKVLPKNFRNTWKGLSNSQNSGANKAAFVALVLVVLALVIFFSIGLAIVLATGLASSPIAGASLAGLRVALAGMVAVLFSIKTFNALLFDLILPLFKSNQPENFPQDKYSYRKDNNISHITNKKELIDAMKEGKEIFVDGKYAKHININGIRGVINPSFNKSEYESVGNQKWRLQVKYFLTLLLSIGLLLLLSWCSYNAITAAANIITSKLSEGLLLSFVIIGTVATRSGFLLKQAIKMSEQLAKFVTWLIFTVPKALVYLLVAIWNLITEGKDEFSKTFEKNFSKSDYKTLKTFFGCITIIPLIMMIIITIGNAASNIAIANMNEDTENRISKAIVSFLSCAPNSMELAIKETFSAIGAICALPAMSSIIAVAFLGVNAVWLIPGLLPVALLGIWIANTHKKTSVSENANKKGSSIKMAIVLASLALIIPTATEMLLLSMTSKLLLGGLALLTVVPLIISVWHAHSKQNEGKKSWKNAMQKSSATNLMISLVSLTAHAITLCVLGMLAIQTALLLTVPLLGYGVYKAAESHNKNKYDTASVNNNGEKDVSLHTNSGSDSDNGSNI